MAETSFPIVEQPLSAEQWKSVTLGMGDGVLDEGGAPYRPRQWSNTDNSVQVSVSTATGYASAIVQGFFHKIDAPVTLQIPAVTTRTTYYVALQYDPAREAMPVQLGVFTSLDDSGGKFYLVLYRIVRMPNQLLTDAEFSDSYPRVAPTGMVYESAFLPDPDSVLYGSVFFVHAENDLVMAKSPSGASDNSRSWVSLLNSGWDEWGDTSAYVYPGHGARRAIQRNGSSRRLRGRIARVTGEPFNTQNPVGYLMASLAPADRPKHTQAFVTACSGVSSPGYARVEVSASSGEVRAWVAQQSSWISLDGIVFDTN